MTWFEPKPEPKVEPTTRVTIVGVDLTIGQLVGLTFKVVIAAIPVGLVLGVLWFLLTTVGRGT